jgi:hypothetical protein
MAEMAASFRPVEFIARHGVVLASAKGPVPSLAEAVAGEPIRGSWWGHKRGSEIFHALEALDDSPDVLCFRLVQKKLTFVHRRLWPALVRLSDELGSDALAAIKQEHTKSGAHRNVVTLYPEWVPPDVEEAARTLSESEARAQLGAITSKTAQKAAARQRG